MRTMINCNYGENFRDLSFPCTEKELQIFCDSLALPNNAGTQIRVDHSHNNPKVDALLAGKEVRLDELNYLMKRLDSFDEGEMNTFYMTARGQKLSSLKDMINLTFNTNCYSFVDDFSELDRLGKNLYLNLMGSVPTKEFNEFDGMAYVEKMMEGNPQPLVTPYGLIYENGNQPQQVYNRRTLPAYWYEPNPIILKITNKGDTEYLYLPVEKSELDKALQRLDAESLDAVTWSVVVGTLINMAIGSPAICAFRLLKGNEEEASRLAKEVFVSLFNKAESSAILDLIYGSREDDAYYKSVFRYCVNGNLQAVLDEYAHILAESGADFAEAMIQSLADTVSLQIDTLESFTGADQEKARMRTHFAVGYFNARISNENVIRTEKIRKAFNSLFRPFVLSTTSIGQEGLDFHFYCRKVMHWNLPSNPIDLEQREGRINRYKCLAVRQNIAHRYGLEPTWDAMFQKAAEKEKGYFSDLVPYWCLSG